VSDAASGYELSSAAFGQALPGSRPQAATMFLHAAELQREGRTGAALSECRRGAALLRTLKAGVEADLVQPCLGVYAAAAGGTDQALLAEMFEAAQLVQGGITSRQIEQSAARLAESARDPRVGAAIRARQDAGARLAELERQRDLRAQKDAPAELGLIPASELEDRLAEARTTLAESDATLQAASPGFGQLMQEVAPAAQVQAALQPSEAFVAITLGRESGWVFALRHDRIAAARLPASAAAVGALVKRVRAGVEPGPTGGPGPFDSQASEALYAAALAPVGPSLEGVSDLVVAPSGPLLSVPFGILLTGPAGADLSHAPWLVRRMSVAHVPAATSFVALRKVAATSRATRPWFGMGGFRPLTVAQTRRTLSAPGCAEDARLLAGLPPLPFTRPELEAARQILGAAPSDELLDQAFTGPRVRQAALQDYRVLHFASHALLPAELACLAEPAIITSAPKGATDASGALLTSGQITGLDLDADTVILSACNTAGPQGPAGESLSGLARAFFYAGARSMLVTHWSINDQSTAYLIAQTLNRARTGGMAAALRGAQLAFLDQAGAGLPSTLAHPFYWGAFALIGDGTTTAGPRLGVKTAGAQGGTAGL
jgi:CHAT domain-containing protein